jgi:hypothetical protein
MPLVTLSSDELLRGAVELAELPAELGNDAEPEPAERFALVVGMLADQLAEELPGAPDAVACLRLAAARLWAEPARRGLPPMLTEAGHFQIVGAQS